MLYYTHILFSLFIALLVYTWLGLPISILALLVCTIGGVFPDIDERHSKVTKKFWIVGWIVSRLSKHRGLFHSLLFALLVSGALYYFFSILNGIFGFHLTRGTGSALLKEIKLLAAWFFVGYVSHLLLDSFTPQGVMWLAPLTKKKIRGKVRTGFLGEKVLVVVLIIAIAILVLKITKIVAW